MGDTRTPPTVHRRVEHGRRVVAPHVLDQSSRCFFFVDCIASRGSGMASGEWSTVVGRSSTGGAAIELAPGQESRDFRLGQFAPFPRTQCSEIDIDDAHAL
jgi:hypothetical protein